MKRDDEPTERRDSELLELSTACCIDTLREARRDCFLMTLQNDGVDRRWRLSEATIELLA